MTTSALSDAAQAAYNESAIDLASRMSSARSAARAAGIFPKTEDERFPLHNRVPLGVAREYARMGKQPLSDATQALGTEFGARFEHLGLTIGTVIHDVTLRDHDEDAFYAFLRQVLLERKVIFFRDQHLAEDEQVAFAKRFGNLDAFPFSTPGKTPTLLKLFMTRTSRERKTAGIRMSPGWNVLPWDPSPSVATFRPTAETPCSQTAMQPTLGFRKKSPASFRGLWLRTTTGSF